MRLVLFMILFGMAAAGACRAQEVSAGPVPYEAALEAAAAPEEGQTVLSQGDSRWSWFRIGTGTVREQGCLVIAIAMVAIDRGFTADPLSLLRAFTMNGLFTRSGMLYTSSLSRIFPGLGVVMRGALSASSLSRVEEQLSRGHDVLVKLDRDLRRGGIQQHWVRVIRSVNGDLFVADPNGGRTGTLRDLYGTTSVVREMLVLG